MNKIPKPLIATLQAPIGIIAFMGLLGWGSYQIWKVIDFNGRHSSGERSLIVESKGSKSEKNNPEEMIYQQNKLAKKGKAGAPNAKNPIKIAVVVPIGTNREVAKEILRGVSLVQALFNNNGNGGVDGKLLEIEIFNDDNKPEIAREVAEFVIKNPQIIAVIGSNASEASIAAAPIYNRGKLVMISPTSGSHDLTGIGDYIFRTTPNTQKLATTLAKYIYEDIKKQSGKFVICFNSQSRDSVSFKNALIDEFTELGGKIENFECDISDIGDKVDSDSKNSESPAGKKFKERTEPLWTESPEVQEGLKVPPRSKRRGCILITPTYCF